MNKAYRHVYKDGIGWVAIAENGSCVSSSKGSGTVSSKTKVEVLKNFFDLRNSVVLNNGFLLKGLFAATLFCGGFVTQGFADMTQKEILDIQNNGTAVYTDNDGNRMEKVINEDGEVIFSDGSILNKADSDGIIHIDGKDYVIPTGTLNKPDTDEFGDKAKLFRVKKDATTGEWRGLTFQELYDESGKSVTSGKPGPAKGKNHTVIYDKDKKKWFVHNQASEAQLYQAKKKNGEVAYYAWTSIQKDGSGVPLKTVDGYYMPIANATAEANEINRLGYDIIEVASKNKAERLSLVGIDGKTVKPIKYDENDQQVKDGKRKEGDNKDGTIRLGNVARAIQDDEAVNLGQLNERLQNVKADKVPYVSIKSSITGDGSNYDNDGAKGSNSIAIGPNAKSGDSSVAIGLSAKTGEGIIDKASYNKINRELNDVKQKYDLAVKKGIQEKVAEFGELKNKYEELLKTYDERYEYNGKLITKAEFDKLNAAEQKKATIKYISKTMYENSVAIGYDAQALANDAVAIGNDAKVIAGGPKVIAGGGVAIGQGSVSNAREDKDLNGYIPPTTDKDSYEFKNNKSAWIATNQPFAVGNDEKITRQITGVAAGNKDTDAVNVAQLKQVGFFISGDTGEKGRIQNDDAKEINTLHIKTDDKWENNDVVYTGRNLETKTIAGGSFNQTEKEHDKSKVQIAMSDTPRFKSITIADDDTMNNKNDDSPIELKKFDDNIGFAGKGDSAIKLTNLADGTIGENSTDAITGGQLQKIIKGGLKFTANSGEHTAELGTQISIKGDAANTEWSNFDNGKNIMTNIDTKGNIVVGLSKELKNITSITNNNKTYTFGDTNLGDTSVITNKDLTEKGYVTADTQKTTSVSTDANSGIKVISEATGKNTDYKLSLDKDKVKEIAGTTNLTADLDKKADKNAGNLEAGDITSWQNKLGINDKADKSDITNLAKTDLTNITDDGKTTIKDLAKGSVEVVGDGDIVNVGKTTANDKDTYKVSVDASKLANNTAFSDNFAKKDASNIADNKANWETALGLGEYVKSVTSKDNFIKVDNTKKQTPVLSLDTEKLANDSTFVTNIAGNNDFTTKLGDTFVTNTSLEAGYTKLDGSNLATIKKDKWKEALDISDDNIKTLAQESVNVKAKDGSKVTVTDKTENGVKTFEVGVDLTGLNGTTYKFTAGDNLSVIDDGNGNVKYSLNKELKNITSITNNNKTYTFGDATLGDTSVITNKDLTEKGYVTADTQKTTSVSTDANSGIKVDGKTTGNNTDYKLSLDETKIKEITGTTNLTADLKGKANVTADNLSSDNVTSWQNKLGINDKADKSDITNLTTKIDNGKFTSLKVSANGGTQDEIKANENIDFSGANGINVNYDATKNKFTFSADIDSIADNNVFSNKYAMLNGSNLKPTNGFDQGAWRTALGLTNDNIASIFEAGTDISITPNGNKYTIAYTGGGTGGISETKVKEIIKKYIGGDITNPTNSNDELITHNVKEQETTENENIIAAINKINQEGIGFVHVNGEKLTRDASGKSKNDSSAEGNNAIAIGPKSRAIGNNSIAIGVGNVVKGENSGAIGDPSMVNADGSYSVGNYNTVNTGADGSFILGNNVFIERDAKQALALGEKTKVSVAGGVALGSGSVANRKTNLKGYIPDGATTDQEKAIKETSKGSLGVVSVGETSADGKTVIASRQITGVAAGTEDSDAVNVAQLKAVQKVVNQGSKWIAVNTKKFDKNGKVVDNSTQAEAKGVNSVAIGAGSNTNTMLNGNEVQRPNTVSVGGLNKDGTVTQRTISNVAPGVLNSDAATMGQLRAGLNDVYGKLGEYKKDASAGTASALAVGNLPQATIPGKGMISLGSGFYDGQSAMAIGLSKMSDSGKWVFKGSASYDSQEKAGAALSVGFHF